VPGFDDDREGPKSGSGGSGRSRLSRNPKALTVALIVMGLTATMLAVGSKVPASAAADCPKGLPSISASATPSRTTAAADKAAARSASALKKTKKTIAGTSSAKATGATKATPTAAPTASPSKDDDGNPIVDGVKGIVGGLGNLLGLGDDPSSSPSGSPSPSETPTTAPTASPTTSPTGAPAPTGTDPSNPTPSGSSEATPAPSASNDDVPCLGPRQRGLKADADGVPLIAAKPGLLEAKSLEMYDATYDGVVNLPTGAGTSVRVLKFSMSRAVNKPFSLTIDEANGATTVITSNELTTAGHVEFYTEHFQGNLFGVIPLTFTPDQPPPLTLPYMPFSDAKIRLNYVQCDELTGIPLHISEE
jgi:hypothetical protein